MLKRCHITFCATTEKWYVVIPCQGCRQAHASLLSSWSLFSSPCCYQDESLYERCELEAKERFSAETARQKNKELARQEVERMAAKRREELGLTNGRGGGGGGDSSFSGDVDMG